MMRYLMLGALLGLFLAFPGLPTLAATVIAEALAQPLLVAFALGLAAGTRTRRPRRWAR
ncbi:hypothetical protein [Streptomyces iakyrus]|uniref:hypothetical protein n=1 Tax=Streptomyces iakyrus TaxID=68219 RepID=UPI0036940FC9